MTLPLPNLRRAPPGAAAPLARATPTAAPAPVPAAVGPRAGGTRSLLSLREDDVVVGVADLRLVRGTQGRLITYALGSCLGVAIHDPVAGVAGLLHVMLPDSAIDRAKGERQPAMFLDTGLPLLFRESYKLGARKERIVVKVAGGAFSGANEADDQFQIGKRNVLMLRKLLWKNNVLLHAHDLGGCGTSRTVVFDVATGGLVVRTPVGESTL